MVLWTQWCNWNMRRNNLRFLHGTATYKFYISQECMNKDTIAHPWYSENQHIKILKSFLQRHQVLGNVSHQGESECQTWMHIRNFDCNTGIGKFTEVYLSKYQVPDLVVDQSTLGEVDQAVMVKIRVAIVQERQVRHVKTPAERSQWASSKLSATNSIDG